MLSELGKIQKVVDELKENPPAKRVMTYAEWDIWASGFRHACDCITEALAVSEDEEIDNMVAHLQRDMSYQQEIAKADAILAQLDSEMMGLLQAEEVNKS